MILPTLEAVLALAVDQLRSRQGLHIDSFISQYPDHAGDLARLLPVLVSLGPGAIDNAMEQDALVVALELHAFLAESAA